MHASRRWLYAIVPLLILRPVGASADEASNWDRLRSMPRERRETLLENLKTFESLSAAEQSAARALDAHISALPTGDQARYHSVLRRYHLWVQSLPEAQQNQLKAAAPEERMRLVVKFRQEERIATPRRRSSPSVLQVADFGTSTPFELAHKIRIWQAFTPQQRSIVDKIANPAEAKQKFNELSKELRMKGERGLTKDETDALVARVEEHLKAKGGYDATLLRRKDAQRDTRLKKRWAENYYFIENPPAPVKADNLLRFEASLPGWMRLPFDHLPADEARRRLIILYRLIYPAGQEMPSAKPAAPAQENAVKPSPPAAKPHRKTAAPTPF